MATAKKQKTTRTILAKGGSNYDNIRLYNGTGETITVTRTNSKGKVISTDKEFLEGQCLGGFCRDGFKKAVGLLPANGKYVRLTITAEEL